MLNIYTEPTPEKNELLKRIAAANENFNTLIRLKVKAFKDFWRTVFSGFGLIGEILYDIFFRGCSERWLLHDLRQSGFEKAKFLIWFIVTSCAAIYTIKGHIDYVPCVYLIWQVVRIGFLAGEIGDINSRV